MYCQLFFLLSALMLCVAFRLPLPVPCKEKSLLMTNIEAKREAEAIVSTEVTRIVNKPQKSKSGKKTELNVREKSGFNFYENGVEYDVPFIDEPKWYDAICLI